MGIIIAFGTFLAAAQLPLAGASGAGPGASDWKLESTHHVEVQRRGSELHVRTIGEDPWLLFRRPTAGAGDSASVLAFEYFGTQGITDLETFYGPPIVAEHRLSLGNLPQAQGWTAFAADLNEASGGSWPDAAALVRIDLGRSGGVSIALRKLTLRELTEEERRRAGEAQQRREATQRSAHAIEQYLEADWPYAIERVTVLPEAIEIVAGGDGPPAAVRGESRSQPDTVELIRLWPEEVSSDPAAGESVAVRQLREGRVRFRVPRMAEHRDAIVCRWRLAAKEAGGAVRPVSACHYADRFEGIGATLERIQPASKKGLGGVAPGARLEELLELGVGHITINLTLTDLIDDQPHPQWTPWRYAGQAFWANRPKLLAYDTVIRFCTEHQIAVSAILLVRPSRTEGDLHPIVHPQADPAGIYAMPNFIDSDAVRWYEAVLELLGSRYAQPGDPHGRISNWILHNEIDEGWTWTNMGPQPMPRYLDTYVRSMRLAGLVARRHNPHARVFISLTHHWDRPEDPRWQTYSSRRLLESLARWTAVEGDFPWGVAYHPYPQSLWDADTWNDDQPHRGFDTPKITLKNIEVLDRFLRQPEFLTRSGDVRPILLSEQGFHTPDYSRASQLRQAAALLYAWRQIEKLASIEAFQYHRWTDAAGEGGLLLGLRTLPTPEHPRGEKKLAWEVLAALGTQREIPQIAALEAILAPQAARQEEVKGD